MRRLSAPTICFLTLVMLATSFAASPVPALAQVSVGISVAFGPPEIPVYVQPPCPAPDYVWVPGYWAYYGGYYWVPGTWVLAPDPGLYWTPGYWGWSDGFYVWNAGYWGPQIGFYGGVDYGYGYYGTGYVGGAWEGASFRYNTAVTNVNRNAVREVYVDRAVAVNTWNRVSYNGGPGGLGTRPTQSELAAQRGSHLAPTTAQIRNENVAAKNRANFAVVNHGRPALAAVTHPLSKSTNRAFGAHHTQAQRTAVSGHEYAQHRGVQQHQYAQHRGVQQHQYAQHRGVVQHQYAQHRGVVQHQYAQHRYVPQHQYAQYRYVPQHPSTPQRQYVQHQYVQHQYVPQHQYVSQRPNVQQRQYSPQRQPAFQRSAATGQRRQHR